MEVLGGGGSGSGSNQVWIDNHPTQGWTPGRVDSLATNGCYVVVDEAGDKFEVPQDKARPVDAACMKGADDLLNLGDFNEGALLHNVRVRYARDDIYTGIGEPILISVNPFQNLPGLYSEAKQKFYRDRSAALGTGNAPPPPPHLFLTAAASYTAMLSDKKNQSIIISGESGAGKTEATKRVLAYFANMQRSIKSPDGQATLSIEDQVLRSNPILEAFGNAKTIRNDNSSRFGKYIDIEFDATGKLQSAQISNYLLEKSRIVKQQPDERGYHAFYQLCAGAASLELNSVLNLYDPLEHRYTLGCTTINGVDDKSEFTEMTECMDSLGFTGEEKDTVFKITAAVLHLGDLEFEDYADSADGTKICDVEKAGQICAMLGVDIKDFTKVFQFKTLEDPFTHKIIDMPQDKLGASNTRHSMARAAYSRLFDWLVWRINKSTMAKDTAKRNQCSKIGILDIYGFEVFEWNSFEQLCINFANEKLQQHFNSHMFTLEQQLYTDEGITWSHIQWQDNREIIDSLEKRPLGLFCIVDSECLMPNATDATALSKIYNSFKHSKICYKPSKFASTNFAVSHYAGEVIYDIVSFLEKNTDKLHADIINLMKSSNMPMLKTLFTDPRFSPELRNDQTAMPKRSAPAAKAKAGGERARQNVTVSMMFRQQLDQLVEDLNKTSPRYIRCIKPNAAKQARDFDSLDIQRQLRCAGMLESIRIRRAGYSVRRPFKDFYSRFRVLCPQITSGGRPDADYKDLCRKLLEAMEARFEADKAPLDARSWQVGRSKVFMKEELEGRLKKAMSFALQRYVLCIQKRWRGFTSKRQYTKMRKAAILLATALRTAQAKADYKVRLHQTQAAVDLQAGLRMLAARVKFTQRRNGAVTIQRRYRGWRCRSSIGRLKGKMAADRIQKMRDEEERKKALDAAKKDAQEKEKALADMQKQLEQQRQEQGHAMRKQEQERSRELEDTQRLKLEEHRQQASQEQEQLRQEVLALKKANARLSGQLEVQPPSAETGPTEAEFDHMRKELQELRREKVKLEVELTVAKSKTEYDALAEEQSKLREELSHMRTAKLDVDFQLEQRNAQLETVQSQAQRGEQAALDLTALRVTHDETQIELQRVKAQKAALDERAQGDEKARDELREMRLEKMRLEGELETSKMREEAISEKLKNSEKQTLETQQMRQKISTMEAELEASKKHTERLKEQMSTISKEGAASRVESLDNLRTELLSRIDRASVGPSARPSLLPVPTGSLDEPMGAGDDRKTLLNQRALFEQITKQFHEAKEGSGGDADMDEVNMNWGDASRELDLEEQLKEVKKENVELNIKLTSLEAELAEKGTEANMLLQSSSGVQAEVMDLKFQVEQADANTKRSATQIAELQAKLNSSDSELASVRRRLIAAEERYVVTTEEAKTLQLKAARFDEEREFLEKRVRELQSQAAELANRERVLAAELEEHRQIADQHRHTAEVAERNRVEREASASWLESENERVKAELIEAQGEAAKIRQVVDELMSAEGSRKNEDMENQLREWKKKAAYYEREYNNSKQLNNEMTKVMSQMTQAVSERSDEAGDVHKQNKMLAKQLDMKGRELKDTKAERDGLQKQLDSIQSAGSFFQDKYREASEELKKLRQEHSIATATASKLRLRIESMQKETEDYKAQCAKMQLDARGDVDDNAMVDRYEVQLRDLQRKLRQQDEELDKSKSFAAKSQAVNDCLNTLLVLESEQTSLYEMACPVKDQTLQTQFQAKKSKAQDVIGRLNEIMTEEERPSIAFLNKNFK